MEMIAGATDVGVGFQLAGLAPAKFERFIHIALERTFQLETHRTQFGKASRSVREAADQ